ncbi:MAG: hypothetical protein FWF38_02475 [Spirochaetaceae bacterium]|nr:hypothetical protein [Spirochaetaceae bacterium]
MIIVSEEKKTMVEDLTFLNHLIALTSTSLDMDIDISLYKNKIIDDVFFINNTLNKIEERVTNSNINEKEFIIILKKIKNIKDSAIILMENIIKYKYKQSIIFEAHSNDIKSFISLYKISSSEIQKRLNKKLSFSQEGNQVSKEELYSLFEQEDSE